MAEKVVEQKVELITRKTYDMFTQLKNLLGENSEVVKNAKAYLKNPKLSNDKKEAYMEGLLVAAKEAEAKPEAKKVELITPETYDMFTQLKNLLGENSEVVKNAEAYLESNNDNQQKEAYMKGLLDAATYLKKAEAEKKKIVPVPVIDWKSRLEGIKDDDAQKLGFKDAEELKSKLNKFYEALLRKKGINVGMIMRDRILGLLAVANGEEDIFGTIRRYKSSRGRDSVMKTWNEIFENVPLEAVGKTGYKLSGKKGETPPQEIKTEATPQKSDEATLTSGKKGDNEGIENALAYAKDSFLEPIPKEEAPAEKTEADKWITDFNEKGSTAEKINMLAEVKPEAISWTFGLTTSKKVDYEKTFSNIPAEGLNIVIEGETIRIIREGNKLRAEIVKNGTAS